MSGTVLHIFTAPAEEAPAASRDEVRAVAGRGLEGDRYYRESGIFPENPEPDREVTLIEVEQLVGLAENSGIKLGVSEPRRNIVTSGVSLNGLVGAEFSVGEVRLRGIRLCEPCSHLEQLTGTPVLKVLVHKAGLRAQIVEGGTIRVGDTILPA
jgi:MOSC domain-containing protein YiiM